VDQNEAVRPTASQQQTQDEIAHEQAYVDRVYARLDEASRTARSLVAEGYARASVGHEGALVERDAMVYQASKRVAALDAAHDGLVFGRLDLVDGEARYIGRIGVRDADRDVLLVDWRAPAASLFYQATAQEPAGVVRRRVLRSRRQEVIGVEDDLLDAENAPAEMVVVGEGALLASLSRARDASMHSVVATIQKEQDEAIRAPSRGATTIGGGPGTGKTVVALHRAAYLLYTDRRRFESGGVLVVGPSGIFMNYIDRVLPSLGETSVTLRSLGEVVDGVKAVRHDSGEVSAIKGSARMRQVLARAVRAETPESPHDFGYFYRDDVLRLTRQDLNALRRQLLGAGQRRNRAYSKVRGHLVDALWQQVEGPRALEDGKETFSEELLDSDEFASFLDAWWPELDAIELWRWLHDPQRLSEFADGVLSTEEQRALLDSWSDGDDIAVEDIPLIDELRYLLGEVPAEHAEDESDVPRQLMSFERAEREDAAERLRTTQSIEDDGFAHVLVDEAQDLSAMQWRMLGRRGKYASWTIVGDAAQSSWPHPDEAAQARADALDGKPEHNFKLSTNYRNSAEIYEFAAEVARASVTDPDLPDAVRRTGTQPQHIVVDSGDVLDHVRATIDEMAARVEGTIAVVTASASRDDVAGRLAEKVGAYGGRVSVMDGLDTKGLELAGVVVVEPDQMTDQSEAGWRTLYVVLTRATQLLTTVGSGREWLNRIEA